VVKRRAAAVAAGDPLGQAEEVGADPSCSHRRASRSPELLRPHASGAAVACFWLSRPVLHIPRDGRSSPAAPCPSARTDIAKRPSPGCSPGSCVRPRVWQHPARPPRFRFQSVIVGSLGLGGAEDVEISSRPRTFALTGQRRRRSQSAERVAGVSGPPPPSARNAAFAGGLGVGLLLCSAASTEAILIRYLERRFAPSSE